MKKDMTEANRQAQQWKLNKSLTNTQPLDWASAIAGPNASLPAASGTTSPSHTLVVHAAKAKILKFILTHERQERVCERTVTDKP